jgi:hypothetical protein
MAGIDIQLSRIDRIYHPGEVVSGVVVVQSQGRMRHGGIKVLVEGSVQLQLSARSIGLFEAFYSSLKPVNIMTYEFELPTSGSVPNGITEFPFEFTLQPYPNNNENLYETYHGVYVNTEYKISVDMPRGIMSSNLKKSKEFIVHVNPDIEAKQKAEESEKFNFRVTPESLQNVKASSRKKIPDFLFEGYLDRIICNVDEPFTGHITIKRCAVEIKSIELQLVRVESCTYMEGEAREATEIQNIQIADGNVVRDLSISMYMIFPRLFTCATTLAEQFKVQFEVNLIVVFADSYMVTENFQIVLYR